MHRTSLAFAIACALAGCGSGCDAEHRRRVDAPHPAAAPAEPVAERAAPPVDARAVVAGAAPPVGYLDATPGSLDPLFVGLAAAERAHDEHGPVDPASRVLWLFFGDSHTAGDSMTSRLRVTLQAKFGDAGRGLVAAGRPPTRHYYQRDVRYGTTGKWKAAVGGHKGDPEPYGIAGLRVYGERKGTELWVETCSDCQTGTRVSQFEILYYAAPDHGLLRYRVDDQPWGSLKTKTQPIEPPHPARQVIPVTDGPHKLTLQHGGGGVIDLFGVVMERQRPGVIVDSLGVVGRRLGSLRSWDWSVIGEQLASRDPRLVVLQYGTNEADDPDLDLEAMARYFDETILRIRAAAPTAAVLVLGPPDMAVREAGKQCDRMKPDPRNPDAPVIPECEWRTPHILSEIISVEHAAALRNRAAFFDTFAAMGGADRMHAWFLAEPRLAYKDHVHLTDAGYQQWADALSGAVLAEYARWRKLHDLPPTPPLVAPPPAPPSDAATPGAPAPEPSPD
ncbi:MAG TPA: GDSL-type esterase/lipase family protein [Kofleriaceae bacterium]|jgi:lysophospholipase L1-like esterase|nr:GDSL-type esterase/lipase family protein [Kofleriaceae bacterium]